MLIYKELIKTLDEDTAKKKVIEILKQHLYFFGYNENNANLIQIAMEKLMNEYKTTSSETVKRELYTKLSTLQGALDIIREVVDYDK